MKAINQSRLTRLMAVAALGLVAACTQPFQARVQSFQALPPERGQSFHVIPAESNSAPSLEFAAYGEMVSQAMRKQGYQPAASAETADLLVQVDYGSGPARERLATRPSMTPTWAWYGRSWYGRHPAYWGGWYGPYGGYGWDRPEVYSFTVYPAFLQVAILKSADKTPVFEGRAETTTKVNDLPGTIPNLVSALFTDFPGESARSKVVQVKSDR